MINWQINNSFIYVPLNVNSISTQGANCSLGSLMLASEAVEVIMEMCLQKTDEPIVFDFFGIMITKPRAFEVFEGITMERPVVFTNVNDYCKGRLLDDGVSLSDDLFVKTEPEAHFWVGDKRVAGLPQELVDLKGRFFQPYLKSKMSVLKDWNKILPSTPVFATKYYDAKMLCVKENVLQVIATALATAILQKKFEFDVIVSSSNTGSLIAVPVSILLGKPLHCWTDFGPLFKPKRGMEWTDGKGKRCLLVADVICMGTEARTAQSFMIASGSNLVACSALATYLIPEKMPYVTLLNRNDLEQMDYRLSIPEMEATDAKD
ncbi:hypothetical protein KAR91_66940 [Candidatus Pacearchaeota archaeon]|nr:hypothetical protein [Candidatus Pacearchaeota archaeon]